MRIILVCLLALAAMAIAMPLAAEEMEAPRSRWAGKDASEAATINWERLSADAGGLPQPGGLGSQQNAPPPVTASVIEKSVEPVKATESTPQKKPADDQESHERAFGVMPMFTVVNDPSTARAR